MSNTQYAFLKKENIPSKEQLQNSIDKLGYKLMLDPEFTPFEDEGFSPCCLNQRDDDVGFEIGYEAANDVTEGDEEFEAIAGDNDYCITMSWQGGFGDCACVMIVSYALATDFGATISYEGGEPETLESLAKGIDEALTEFTKKTNP